MSDFWTQQKGWPGAQAASREVENWLLFQWSAGDCYLSEPWGKDAVVKEYNVMTLLNMWSGMQGEEREWQVAQPPIYCKRKNWTLNPLMYSISYFLELKWWRKSKLSRMWRWKKATGTFRKRALNWQRQCSMCENKVTSRVLKTQSVNL